VIGRDVRVVRDGQHIRLAGTKQQYGELTVPLLGAHQAVNCATAVAAVEASGLECGVEAVVRGLAKTNWPGRFQVVRQEPTLIVDGAHNPHGAERLAATLQEQFPGKELTLILGVLRDKDYPQVCRVLASLAKRVLCVPVSSERSATADEIARCCREAAPQADVCVCGSVLEALRERGPVTVVAGSLFLVGETLALLRGADNPSERRLQ
jgi:dihydrofolate synthase/folylpolyglutamate synthase